MSPSLLGLLIFLAPLALTAAFSLPPLVPCCLFSHGTESSVMTVMADTPYFLALDMPEPALSLMASMKQMPRPLGGTPSAANMESACSVTEAGHETAGGLPLSWTLLILVLALWSLWAAARHVWDAWGRLTAMLQKLCEQNELLLHRMNCFAEITARRSCENTRGQSYVNRRPFCFR